MKTFKGLPAPDLNSFSKLLCFSLLIVPSTLVEGKIVTYRDKTDYFTAAKMLASKAVSARTAAARNRNERLINARLAASKAAFRAAAKRAEIKMISIEAIGLADELRLQDSGLNEKVLEYALMGYHRLAKKGTVRRTDILSICDFSQPSSVKRMYIIDVRNRRLLYRTYVAHGISSGEEYANSFSNVPESHKSSLGFYVTRGIYYGANGLSLRIDGLDRGFNNLASERAIVIHGAPYVSERILRKYGVMGTTFGCPAIPEEQSSEIIPLLKGGTCFFIYYPSQKYLSGSSVLNGQY